MKNSKGDTQNNRGDSKHKGTTLDTRLDISVKQDSGMLSRSDTKRVLNAFNQAIENKLLSVERVQQFASGLDDLGLFEFLSRDVLKTNASGEAFQEFLALEQPWPTNKRFRPSQKEGIDPVITLPSPGAPLLAAWIVSGGD